MVNDFENRPVNSITDLTVDLAPIFRKARRHWALLAAAFVLFLIFGFGLGLMRTPQYTVQVTVAAKMEAPGAIANAGGPGAGGGSTSATGALMSLFGTGGSAPPSDFDQYQRLLISRAAANIIVAHPEIMHRLVGGWNEETKSWQRPSGVIFWLSQFERSILGRPLWSPPGAEEVYQALQRKFKLQPELTSSFIDVTMTDSDPKFAVTFIYFMHHIAQQLVKDSIRADSTARIAYLDNQLQSVTFTDQRQILISLLAAEQQRLMMIQADKELVAQVIDPAILPKSPSSLSPAVLSLMAGVVGLILTLIALAFISEDRLLRIQHWTRRKTVDRLPSWQFR